MYPVAREAHNGQPKVNTVSTSVVKTVFSGRYSARFRNQAGCSDNPVRFNEDERSLAANPNAADPPAIAVPEALTLPVAAIGIACGDIGRATIIGRGGAV